MTKLQKMIILALGILLAGLLLASGILLVTRQDPEPIVNEFVPPEFDASAQNGTPGALDAALSYGSLELTERTVVSMCANIICENNAARVYFTSHDGNEGWLKIKLFDADGTLLGQSGLLRPGQYIESVTLTAVPKKSGLIVAKILIYEPDTYLSLGSASAQVALSVN